MAQMVVTAGSLMRSVLLPFILVALLLWNLPTVNFALGNLLAMTARIQSLEASGVKVAFRDPKKLDLLLTAAEVDQSKIGRRIDALSKLTGAHIERLFTIDPTMVNCLYTKPDMRMSVYLTLDYQLQKWDFVRTKPAEKALAELLEKAGGKESDIGLPLSCYTMELTDTGYDAKTVLLGIIRAGFDGTAAQAGA
jgi:hypothetical protein